MSGAHSRPSALSGATTEVVAGAAVVVSVGGMAISLALLIFAGAAVTELPQAIGSFMIGAAILCALLAWRGRLVPTIGVLQDGPAVVMVPVAAGIAESGDLGPTMVLPALGLVGLLTAVAMVGLSRLRVVGIVRYLPTSVVVAFIAGTGWYLSKGGIEVMVSHELGLAELGDVLGWEELQRWLPGLALAVLIVWFARRRDVPPIAGSIAIVASVLVFFVVVLVVSSVAAVERDGWLIGPFPADAAIGVIDSDTVADLDWMALLGHAPGLLAVVAIAVIAMLLNYSGLEMLTGEQTDQRNELEVTGLAALLAAPFGSVVGFVGLGDTMLARQLGIKSRVTPIVAGALVAAFALVGTGAVAMVPRFVTGGLLLAIGLELLVNWVGQLRNERSLLDASVGVLIVGVMAAVGILEGLAVGLFLMCALFIVRYSRIDHVRRSTRGVHKSRVDRSPAEHEHLLGAADRVVVFELEGYLFFGSVVAVTDQIREHCASSQLLDAVIVDFRHVSGIDANGLAALESMRMLAAERDAKFVVCGLDPATNEVLAATVDPPIETFPTLNRAVEFVEEHQLLSWRPDGGVGASHALAVSDELRAWFTPESVASGAGVVGEGEPSSTMYLVVSGSLVAVATDGEGVQHRLRRFGAGALVGEVGFFSGDPRSATVTAGTDASLLRLDRSGYERMRDEAPALALELHEFVLAGQSARVRSLSDELKRALGS